MLSSLLLVSALAAVPNLPNKVQVWSAEAIQWSESRPGGTQRTILEGDLETPGAVVSYAFRMPDGAWFPAHTHSTSARVFVVKGTLLLGEGGSDDRTKVRRVRAGEVALVPAGVAHYEGAEGETVIIGVATGPWTTTFLAPVKKP